MNEHSNRPLEVDRSNISDPIVKTRMAVKPRELLGDIEAAIAMGLDWHVECVYFDEAEHDVHRPAIQPMRRHRLTIWAPVDTAAMREALAMLVAQRAARGAHPTAAIDYEEVGARVVEMGGLNPGRAPRVRT